MAPDRSNRERRGKQVRPDFLGQSIRSLVLRGTLAVAATCTVGGCGEPFAGPIERLPRELSIAEGKLIEADNRFAFNLFHEINGLDDTANVFISPLSVAMALGMTYNGAAGATLEAMQRTRVRCCSWDG